MSRRSQFAEVVRTSPVDLGLACLLVGGEVDPGLDVAGGLRQLDELAAAARADVPRRAGPRGTADALARALGEREGFSGTREDYTDLRSSLLHEVLQRRRGLPLLLCVVWLEVARRLDLPAYPVALPGHVVVGIGDPDGEHVLADPFAAGRVLDEVDLGRRLGNGAHAEPPRPLGDVDLLLRLLTNVRVLTTRWPPSLEAARTRLWATELSLLLPRHSLELRRERGELLVRLGDHVGGATELETYADAVADDPAAAEAARRAARTARAQLN